MVRRMGLRHLLVPLCLVAAACSRIPESESPVALPMEVRVTPPRVGRPAEAVTDDTALLTLELHPDGSALLTGTSRRPIPFRGRGLIPFDAVLHTPTQASPTAPRGAVTGTSPTAPAALPIGPTASPPPDVHPQGPTDWFLVIQGPGPATTPLVLPLSLGAPGEGGGDVVDRWEGSTLIVRAPSYGTGTRYGLLHHDASGVTLASSLEEP